MPVNVMKLVTQTAGGSGTVLMPVNAMKLVTQTAGRSGTALSGTLMRHVTDIVT